MPQDQEPQVTLEDFEEKRRQYYGIPKGLAESLKTQESGGNQYDTRTGGVLTSPKQAKGRFQVLQSTADKYGLNASDPFENTEAAFRYLSDLNKQVDKNVTDPGERWAQTLAGYHAGEGRLKRVNQTGMLPSTSDGKIRTDDYVSSIMNRWQRYDQGREGGEEQPESAFTRTSAPSTAQRLGLKPAEGMHFDLSGGTAPQPVSQRKPKKTPPSLPTRGPVIQQEPAVQDVLGQARTGAERLAGMVSPEVTAEANRREAARREYYSQPLSTQLGKEVAGGLASAGAGIGRAVNRVTDPLGRALGFGEDVERERQQAAESERQLAEEEAIANRLRSKVVRGAAGGAATAATMAPVAALGGIPAVMGATALQQDWERDPEGAALATATAGLPIFAGRAVSPFAGRVAGSLASPLARKAAQVGIEAGAGGLTGAGQYAGTQALLGREIDPQEALAQGITGAGIAGVMAPKLRRPEPLAPAVRAGEGGTDIINLRGSSQGEPPVLPSLPPRQTTLTRLTPEAMRQAGTIAEAAAPVIERGPRIAQEQRMQAIAPQVIEAFQSLGPRPADEMGALNYDIRQAQILDQYGLTAKDVLNIFNQDVPPNIAAPRGTPIQEKLAGQPEGTAPLVRNYRIMPEDLAARPEPEPTEPLPETREQYAQRKLAEYQARQPVQSTQAMPQPEVPPTNALRPAEPNTGQRLIERTRQAAQTAIDERRYDDAVNELKAHIQALKDAKAQARKQPGLRVQLERQIGQVGNQIGEVRKLARNAARQQKQVENAPTAELPKAQPANVPTGSITEPTNRISQGEGNELPRQPRQELSGQPIELPAPTPKTLPPVEQMSYEDVVRHLDDIANVSTKEDLKKYSPLLRSLFPDYTETTKPDSRNDYAYGIWRMANRGDEVARIPRVDLFERYKQATAPSKEHTNRITGGEGAELPRQPSQELEGQPVENAPTSKLEQAKPGRTVTVGDKEYTLTPEQEARWKKEVDEATTNARQYAGQWRQSNPQRADSILKGRMMEIAGVKREIVGALTPKEQAKKERQAAANVAGKKVSVDGENATVVNTPFGKVRVRFQDGREAVVPREKIAAPVEEKPAETTNLKPAPGISREFTNRITEGAGGELPKHPSQRLEGQPIEIPPRVSREFTNRIAGGEGAELPRQPRQELEGQPVEIPERASKRLEGLNKRLDIVDRRIADKSRQGEETGEDFNERRRIGAEIEKITGKPLAERPTLTPPREPAPPIRENAIPQWMRNRDITKMNGTEATEFYNKLREESARQEVQGYDNVDKGLWDTTRTLLKAAQERRKELRAARQPVTPLNEPRKPMTMEERTAREQRATEERLAGERQIPAVYREDVGSMTDERLSKLIRDVEQAKRISYDPKSELGQRREQFLNKLREEQKRREGEAKPTTAELRQREPWQMTRGEFENEYWRDANREFPVRRTPVNRGILDPFFHESHSLRNKINWTLGEIQQARTTLRQGRVTKAKQQAIDLLDKIAPDPTTMRQNFIERALREGKPVPPEVLADYPDLQGKPTPPPAPTGRKIQHSQFGEVTESENQSGVKKGMVRVTDSSGASHIIRNPRIAGNQNAAFVKAEAKEEATQIAKPAAESSRTPPTMKSPKLFSHRTLTPEDVQQHIGRNLSREDLSALAGAPQDAEVTLKRGRGQQGRPAMLISVKGGDIKAMEREVYTDNEGKLVLYNGFMQKAEGVAPGFAKRILDAQVEAARRLGVDRIEATAGGKPGGGQNGYYTLPAMGFDGTLEARWLRNAPEGLKDATTVQELFSRPGGREWWRENGHSFDAVMEIGKEGKPTSTRQPTKKAPVNYAIPPEAAPELSKPVGKKTPAIPAEAMPEGKAAVKPTPAEAKQVASKAKVEKADPRTGLTKTQETYVKGKLEKALPDLLEAPEGTSLTIDVPGDGKFRVPGWQGANNLHRRITGKNLPNLPPTAEFLADKAGVKRTVAGTPQRGGPPLMSSDETVARRYMQAYGSAERAQRAIQRQLQAYGEDASPQERQTLFNAGERLREMAEGERVASTAKEAEAQKAVETLERKKELRKQPLGQRIADARRFAEDFEEGQAPKVGAEILKERFLLPDKLAQEVANRSRINEEAAKAFYGKPSKDYAASEQYMGAGAPPAKPKFVTDAEQRLKDASTGKLAGSGTQQLADAAIVTGWKVYEKGMEFKDWAEGVVKEVGEKVRPHLQRAWAQIQKDYAKMSSESSQPRLKPGAELPARLEGEMARLQNSPTSPVDVAQLRERFPDLNKEQFDNAMLRLAEQNRIALHGRNFVGNLTPEERNKLVQKGERYFTGATPKGADISSLPSPQRIAVEQATLHHRLAGEDFQIENRGDGNVAVVSANSELVYDTKGKLLGKRFEVGREKVLPPSPRAKAEKVTGNDVSYEGYPAKFQLRKAGSKWEVYETGTGEPLASGATKSQAIEAGKAQLSNTQTHLGLIGESRTGKDVLRSLFGEKVAKFLTEEGGSAKLDLGARAALERLAALQQGKKPPKEEPSKAPSSRATPLSTPKPAQSAAAYLDALAKKNPLEMKASRIGQRVVDQTREELRRVARRVSLGKMTNEHQQQVAEAADTLMHIARTGDAKATAEARQALKDAVRFAPGTGKMRRMVMKTISSTANIPRTVQTLVFGTDVSFPMRQDFFLTMPPSQWGTALRATRAMWDAGMGETGKSKLLWMPGTRASMLGARGAEARHEMINSHPDAELARKAGLELAQWTGQEEVFKGSLVGKVPWIRRTEAANEAFHDFLRLETFSKWAKAIKSDTGKTDARKAADYEGIAEVINTLSGRTDLGEGRIKGAMQALNGVLSAPRLTVSRAQLLNPAKYYQLYRESPKAAGKIASMLGQTAGLTSALMGLAAYSGAVKVPLDPDDPEFGKIRIGNTRYDLSGGMLPFVRLGYKLTNLLYQTGRTFTDESNSQQRSASEAGEAAGHEVEKFSRSRLSPVFSLIYDALWKKKDITGAPVTAKELKEPSLNNPIIQRTLIPSVAKDFYDGWQDAGGFGVAKSLPAVSGVGVSTYEGESSSRSRRRRRR